MESKKYFVQVNGNVYQGSLKKQNQQDMYTQSYFKELAHTVMEAW